MTAQDRFQSLIDRQPVDCPRCGSTMAEHALPGVPGWWPAETRFECASCGFETSKVLLSVVGSDGDPAAAIHVKEGAA